MTCQSIRASSLQAEVSLEKPPIMIKVPKVHNHLIKPLILCVACPRSRKLNKLINTIKSKKKKKKVKHRIRRVFCSVGVRYLSDNNTAAQPAVHYTRLNKDGETAHPLYPPIIIHPTSVLHQSERGYLYNLREAISN